MRVLLFHPWGGFDPVCCGAGYVACAFLDYSQHRGWDVECVVQEIPAWGISRSDPAAMKGIRTIRLDCSLHEPRQYGNEFCQLLYASERATRTAAFRAITREKWDVFFTTDVIAAPFALALPHVTRKILAVGDSHTRRVATTECASVALRDAETRFTFARIEAELYQVFDHVLFCSEDDVLASQKCGVKSALRVPLPIREPAVPTRAEIGKEHDLLICGSARSGELADVEWFYRHVYLPHLRASGVRLALAGPVADQFSVADVRVTKVPAKLGMYHSTRVVVTPACEAAGPCAPAMDALAAGCAVVGTPLAMRGLELPGDAAAIIEMRRDPAGTAAVIRNLLATPGWRRVLGERAEQVKQRHTRKRFFAALDAAWELPARSSSLAGAW